MNQILKVMLRLKKKNNNKEKKIMKLKKMMKLITKKIKNVTKIVIKI